MARKTRAATARVLRATRLRSWGIHHVDCARISVSRLRRAPLAGLLTAAVLGLGLALPGALYLLTANVLALGALGQDDSQITLYLYPDAADSAAEALSFQLAQDARFRTVTYLSRDRALSEFKAMSGVGDALDGLEENPLPPMVIVTPRPRLSAAELEGLAAELSANAQVELAQLDLEWLRRLRASIAIIRRGLAVVAAALAAAVVLVVGNTIRLEIENRQDEISITRLFGATRAYIRRPFLYDGALLGLCGGLAACAIIFAALWALHAPVARLAALYRSDFTLIYPGPAFVAALLALGALLGYLGAWVAVGRHIDRPETE